MRIFPLSFNIKYATCFGNLPPSGHQENHVLFIQLGSKSISFYYKIAKDLGGV